MPTTQYDAALDLSLGAMRVDAATRRRVRKILKKLERELLAKLSGSDLTAWSRTRLNKQLADARKLIAESYAAIAVVSGSTTEGIATVSAVATAAAMSVGVATAIVPPKSVLDLIANGAVIQGATQGAWWKQQGRNTAWKYAQAVRQGIAASETNAQIIRRVRRELEVTQRQAASLVQTSVQTVMNEARAATFDANLDIIKRFRAVTALDIHVCVECAPLADKEWKTDGTPIGHSHAFPTYPLHFNCRCLLIPVMFDGPQGGTRASDEGQVRADLTFEKFLERKGTAYQNEVLGPGRAQLWRDGKITLSDLTTGTNRPILLKTLQEKYGDSS